MSKAAPSPRWFAGWRAERQPQQQDAADLGTAWGLDMSMVESTNEPVAPPVPRRRGWAQRLGLQRKPAA
jgi:hypothetical protein